MEKLEAYKLDEEVPFNEVISSLMSGDQPIFKVRRPDTGEEWKIYGDGRFEGFGEAPLFGVNGLALALIKIDAEFEITCRRKVDPRRAS